MEIPATFVHWSLRAVVACFLQRLDSPRRTRGLSRTARCHNSIARHGSDVIGFFVPFHGMANGYISIWSSRRIPRSVGRRW